MNIMIILLLAVIITIILLSFLPKKDIRITPILNSISDEKCAIEEWGNCCCTCDNHLEDYHHCSTTPGRQPGTCYCNYHKGWICIPPDSHRAHSGWTKHGYCELHKERK